MAGFDAYGPGQSEGRKSNVDWDALNSYVVEQAGLQERETLVGVVSGIVDLGTQEQPDAEYEFTGSEEDEAAEIEKNPDTYFKDGFDQVKKKTVRMKCYPQKPIQSVAVSIDFPDVIVDKGQFFDNPNPQPLRLWLGGSFYMGPEIGTVVARPTPLRVVNINKGAGKPTWSFAPNHLFHKMAVAAKLVKPSEAFLPKDIDQLIGQAFQFEAQVFFKEHKGSEYYTEYVKFVGALGRGQSAPEIENTFMIQFNQKNDPEDLKQIRNHVINTMKRAQNWEGSAVQKQLEEAKGSYKKSEDDDYAQQEEKKEEKPKNTRRAAPPPPADDDLDDDIPF